MTNPTTEEQDEQDPEASYFFPPGKKEVTLYCIGDQYYSTEVSSGDDETVHRQLSEFSSWMKEGKIVNVPVYKGMGSPKHFEFWASPELVPELMEKIADVLNQIQYKSMKKWT